MALHVLVVDDDADVLAVLVEMLQVSGFTVRAADSGVAMRETLADKASLVFDAVVLDSTMPGEPSARPALLAKSLRLPAVMVSGSIGSMKFAEEHGLQLLRKPFRIADLLASINEAIGSGEFGQRDA